MNILKIYRKLIISGNMKLITGIHIGDSKESVEIGGVDNPVVRRKDNNQPYIPGSSLKGKMRCLLEQASGFWQDGFKQDGKEICLLFGSSDSIPNKGDGNASRIIFRDAYLTIDWEKKLIESDYTDMPYTEIKFENTVNRISGTAEHPRQQERIPASAEFNVNFIINVASTSPDLSNVEVQKIQENFMDTFTKGLQLLKADYLGGSGSRGYGQVDFKNLKYSVQSYSIENNLLAIKEDQKDIEIKI